MKEIKGKAWKFNLGLSVTIHTVIIFLCLAVIGNAAVARRDVMTIVLDGQAAYASCPRYDSPPRTKEKEPPAASPVQKRIAQASPKVVRQEPSPPQTATIEPPTNDQSQVATVADAHTVNHAADSSEQNRGTRNAILKGQPTDHAGLAARYEGPSERAQAVYMKEHFSYIRKLITKNLTYPHAAKRFGWKGSLTVSFVICEGGRVENIRIVKSSGHKILDDNVVNTIKSIQPFPRPPVKAEIVIPIEYRFG